MKAPIYFAIMVGVLLSSALFAADKRAKTEDGKEVILRDDGTWYYVGQANKDKKAKEVYKAKRGTFILSMTPGVWKKSEKRSSPDTEVEFKHKEGDIYALVVAERISIPLEPLKMAVLANIRKQDQEAKIREEKKRTVNGSEVLFLAIDAKVNGISLTYMYYLYSGKAGAIQIITATGQNLFKESRTEMEAFMNGFEVIKK